MVFKFAPSECLRQNMCILIFRGNVLKQYYSPLHTIFEMVVLDIYVLGLIMKQYNALFSQESVALYQLSHIDLDKIDQHLANFLPLLNLPCLHNSCGNVLK